MLVFVLDGTEDTIVYSAVKEARPEATIDVENNIDRSLVRVVSKPYDVIVITKAVGKAHLFDLAEMIRHSKIVNRADVIVVENNPSVKARTVNRLSGLRVHSYKYDQLDAMKELLKA